MAYSQTLNLVTGDTLPELTFTLKDSQSAASGKTLDENDASTWAPIDITGGSEGTNLRRSIQDSMDFSFSFYLFIFLNSSIFFSFLVPGPSPSLRYFTT